MACFIPWLVAKASKIFDLGNFLTCDSEKGVGKHKNRINIALCSNNNDFPLDKRISLLHKRR